MPSLSRIGLDDHLPTVGGSEGVQLKLVILAAVALMSLDVDRVDTSTRPNCTSPPLRGWLTLTGLTEPPKSV